MKMVKSARLAALGLGLSASIVVASPAWLQPQPAPAPPAAPAKADQPAEALPKAEDVLDRFVKETGGKAAYEAIKSLSMAGKMELPGGMTGTLKVMMARPGKLRSEMSIENVGEMTSGSDGETVWSDSVFEGPRILDGAERELALESTRMSDEANWRERYKEVKVVAVETVSGKPAYKVELAPKEGGKRFAFYDKESGLVVKQSMVIDSVRGQMPVDVLVSDYKKVGDLLFPHKQTMSVVGQEMVTTFEKIEINTEIPADKFELPASIKELKAKKAEKKTTPPAPAADAPKSPEKK